MKHASILIFLGIFLMYTSCARPDEDEVYTHVHNATIKAQVNLLQIGTGGQYVYIPIKGATVDLYETAYDRENRNDLVKTRTTDSTGLAILADLVEDYYFIEVTHPSYGSVYEETTTPDGSVSLVQIDF